MQSFSLRNLTTSSGTKLITGSILEMHRTFTMHDIINFRKLSWDENPLHVESDVAKQSQFQKPIVHGMLVASMFSALIGNKVHGAIYLTQSFKWTLPVLVGDTITARVEVLGLKSLRSKTIATMKTTCVNQDLRVVLDGQATCLLP